jgi:hypothetical protein
MKYNQINLEVLMKYRILSVLLFALVLSACGSVSTPSSPTASAEPAVTEPTEAPIVEDQASLITALEASGATLETGEPVTQAFFSPEGNIIKVNGADVQVFEYESTEAMENEASQVAPDGGSIGTTMVTWIDTPHFYKAGRIIVLYVGSDATVLDLLENALGAQFAGR